MNWRKHPVLKPPTDAEMAKMEPETLINLWNVYHSAIANSERDPYRYGFRLPHWDYADKALIQFRTALLFGANRSGKTAYCAKQVVEAATQNADSIIYCFSQNKEISVLVQQGAIYHALPEEYKGRHLTSVESINYSFKNGFTDNNLVLPNRSRIVFKFYTQWLQDDTILEGMELGSPNPVAPNVGAWLDEYLLGMDLIDRLYLRLATRDAKLLISFTPKDGETETVKNFREKAKTLEYREVTEGLQKPHRVPYLQENVTLNTGIVYFHSIDNPWSGYKTLLEQCIAKNDDQYTLTALYGVPTKTVGSQFPLFSKEVNVITHDKIPRENVTRYMILDPAGRKNWFMCWIAVDATETYYVYREWPDVAVGDWAKWHGGKIINGEGCKGLGYGIKDYVDLIMRYEAGEKEGAKGEIIFERIIDPRLGAAKYQGQNGASSIIEDLSDAGLIFIPAPGVDIEDGLQALQTKMSYIPSKPIDGLNRPHFYVSDRCENIISALQEYTGSGGSEEAWKDPIDVIRYAAISRICYIDEKSMISKTKNRGGY